MASNNRKFFWIILRFFLSGIALVGATEVAFILGGYQEKTLPYIFSKIFFELGIAIIIACIVAFVFEMWLSEERIKELGEHLGRHKEIESFGFNRIYADRQEVFDDLFQTTFHRIRHELKIMGICVSLFREAERGKRVRKQMSPDRIITQIVEILKRGSTIQVLFLKRYPTSDELKRYGIEKGDFFLMRERDEDYDPNFWHGKRLKKIANRSFGSWIKILLEIADHTQGYGLEKRKSFLGRLQIREYLALPSLSLYIADEDIFVTPYLYKRHCSDVPTFKITGRNSPLYMAYDEHFAVTWDNKDFTTPAISEEFVRLLAEYPQQILLLYKKKHKEISSQLKSQFDMEDPEYYRDYEKVIELILDLYVKKHQEVERVNAIAGDDSEYSRVQNRSNIDEEVMKAILREEGIVTKGLGYRA